MVGTFISVTLSTGAYERHTCIYAIFGGQIMKVSNLPRAGKGYGELLPVSSDSREPVWFE